MRGFILFWMGLILLSGTVRGESAQGEIPLVASIIPLGDFCEKVGGDRVKVHVLMPPGASPHVFEPSPSAMAKVLDARIFVLVGAGLEPWAGRVLQSVKAEDLIVIEAIEGITLIEELEGYHDHSKWIEEEESETLHSATEPNTAHGEEGAIHGKGNPHLWLDPVIAQAICRRIAEVLMKVDPGHSETYEANLRGYLSKLSSLHREIRRRVASFSTKDYVAFHPAFAYFARRYGLQQRGVIEASPGREPTPGHLQRIVTTIRDYGIRVVFTEPQLSPRVAQVIAKEAGVEVLSLDPIGGRPPYGSDYIQMMRHNLSILEKAMR